MSERDAIRFIIAAMRACRDDRLRDAADGVDAALAMAEPIAPTAPTPSLMPCLGCRALTCLPGRAFCAKCAPFDPGEPCPAAFDGDCEICESARQVNERYPSARAYCGVHHRRCPECGGVGWTSNVRFVCAKCLGTGRVPGKESER
jgi:hypothetical protein